jgi:ubiquinone/menaquinone biosynthesis C-methylase UbiE
MLHPWLTVKTRDCIMLNKPDQADIKCGQAVYTKKSLSLYDFIVTRFSNRFIWQCPRQDLIHFFKENTSHNHLDIGVGTGYFLEQLHLTPGKQRIGLLDLNKHCLDYAEMKLHQFYPEVYQHDVFEPFTSITNKFDSVSLNYVLHCLPGTMSQKAVTFDHVKDVLNPGGKFFGTTILGKGTRQHCAAKKLQAIYNNKKIFHNLNDDKEILMVELKKRFSTVELKMKGCVALFVAY